MVSFSDYNAPELRACAKHFKIKGISKIKKADLVALCNEHLKILKSGEVKLKSRGGKSAFSKIKHGVKEGVNKGRNVVTGSTGSKTGDAGLAGVTGTVQAGNPEGNPNYSQEQGKDIADNYNTRRSGTSDYNKQQKKQMKKDDKKYQWVGGTGIKISDAVKAIDLLQKLGYSVKKNSKGGDADADEEETTESKSGLQKKAEKVGDIAYKKGSKEVQKQSKEMYDNIVSNQDYRDTSNPDFVEEEGFGPDLGRALPVLDGPAKQAADFAGKKLDAMTVGVAVAAMKEAGVPSKVADDLKAVISPYSNIKYGFKVLKSLGRTGSMKIGDRGRFAMATMNEAAPHCSPHSTGVSLPGTDMRDCMKVYDAALLTFDLSHLNDPSTQYAFNNKERPYVTFLGDPMPEYVKAMEDAYESGAAEDQVAEYDPSAADGLTGKIAPSSGGETKEQRFAGMPSDDDYANFAKMMQGGALTEKQRKSMETTYNWCKKIGNKLACMQPSCEKLGLCDAEAAKHQIDPIHGNAPQKKKKECKEQEDMNRGYDIHNANGEKIGAVNLNYYLIAVRNPKNGHFKNVKYGSKIDTYTKNVANGQILVIKDKNIMNGYDLCNIKGHCGTDVDPMANWGCVEGGQLPKKTLNKLKELPLPHGFLSKK